MQISPYDWSRVISEHLPLLGRNPQVWHVAKPPKRTTIWIHLSVGQNWHHGRCSFQHCTWKFFIKASTIWWLFCVDHCWSILPQLAASWFIGPCDGAISFSKTMPNQKIINQLIQNSNHWTQEHNDYFLPSIVASLPDHIDICSGHCRQCSSKRCREVDRKPSRA